MNFELNDVASSSSSSSSSQSDDGEVNGSSSSDHEVDETLAYEVRSALHLAVGKICRAEDNAEKLSSSTTAEISSNNTSPAFAMSKEAIVALTDLTYHYSTTLLSNDLVTFSKHAKRQTVKTDDVLLMARKDKKGMLSELKRIMSDNPDLYIEGSKKKKTKGLKSSAAVQKRKKVVNKINKRVSAAATKSKGKAKGGGKKKESILSSSDDSSDESVDNKILKERRRKLDLERSKNRKSNNSHRNARQDDGDDGSDVESLIANNDSFDNNDNSDSSEEVEFEVGMMASNKKKGGADKKRRKKKSKQRKNDSSVDLSESNDDGDSEDMVIDLAGD